MAIGCELMASQAEFMATPPKHNKKKYSSLLTSRRIFYSINLILGYALGENRTHILSFGGSRAIRCTTRALGQTVLAADKIYYTSVAG